MIGRSETGGFDRVLHSIDALDADHQEEIDRPPGLGEQHDGLGGDRGQETARELFTLKRGVGDGRALGVTCANAHGNPFGATRSSHERIRSKVGTSFDRILHNDVTHLEEEGGVDVPRPDEVQEQLLVQ